jgi:hypothetical protein
MDMKIRRSATFLLIASILIAASAWTEPDGFRELKWDSSVSDFVRIFPGAAEKTDAIDRTLNGRRFALEDRIGKVPVALTFYFIEDKFKIVSLTFSSSAAAFRELGDIFKTRYGQPTLEKSDEMGWHGRISIILAQSNRNEAGNGYATIGEREDFVYIGKRRKIELKEAGRGL